jgi:hypothetical protein
MSISSADELASKFMAIHRVHWPEFDCTCEMRPIDNSEGPPSI